MKLSNYIKIARPDHWFKNIFVFPGTLIAALFTAARWDKLVWPFLIGLAAACFVASANYVINEWLDARFDRFHPVKKQRASVAGTMRASSVYAEYVLLAVIGLGLAALVSRHFFLMALSLLGMGILYNVQPFRTKDRVHLDVLSESVNNPIRLLLGWFVVTSAVMPPSSLILGYWMGGAFLMAVKRFAELRFLSGSGSAGLYRRSFQYYTEETLLIASFFYAMCSLFFLGIFLIKYRIELILSVPLFALLFAWYLRIGMKDNSPAQHPERLYREKKFIAYVAVLAVIVGALFVIDIPPLSWFLNSVFNQEIR
jgi:4-hydroxybenzoate polyprenyltransferase